MEVGRDVILFLISLVKFFSISVVEVVIMVLVNFLLDLEIVEKVFVEDIIFFFTRVFWEGIFFGKEYVVGVVVWLFCFCYVDDVLVESVYYCGIVLVLVFFFVIMNLEDSFMFEFFEVFVLLVRIRRGGVVSYLFSVLVEVLFSMSLLVMCFVIGVLIV